MKTLSELRLERGCGGQARRWPARGCRLGWRGQAGCAALGDMEFVQVFGKAWGGGVQEHPSVGLENRKVGPRTERNVLFLLHKGLLLSKFRCSG